MSSVPRDSLRMTPVDYLRGERLASARSEYYDGEVVAMSGGTLRHSLICNNLGGELRERLRGKPCVTFNADAKVRITGRAAYVYPDVTVVCGPAEPDASDPTGATLTNPTVVVEVLSESTERHDRGTKFHLYGLIPSLRQYVLVSQDRAMVEVLTRQGEQQWRMDIWQGLEATARLDSIGVELRLSEVYLNADVSS